MRAILAMRVKGPRGPLTSHPETLVKRPGGLVTPCGSRGLEAPAPVPQALLRGPEQVQARVLGLAALGNKGVRATAVGYTTPVPALYPVPRSTCCFTPLPS